MIMEDPVVVKVSFVPFDPVITIALKFVFLFLTSTHLYFSSSELAAKRNSLPSAITANEYSPCISGPWLSSWKKALFVRSFL